MPSVLVISSYVAASTVGGGLAPVVLSPLGVETILVPTTLLGRHPGWGAPGGGPVSEAQLRGVLEGVEANGLFSEIDAVLVGYFVTTEQVQIAADAIDRVRAAPRSGPAPLVLVDPIMGDLDVGPYVPEQVAAALIRQLVPRADLIACNPWELNAIAGIEPAAAPESMATALLASGRDWLVSSMATAEGVGALLADSEGARLALAPRVSGRAPRGTGDLLKLRFLGGVLSGEDRNKALARAVGLTSAMIERAAASQSPELPLAAAFDLLANAPEGWIEPLP